MTNNPTDHPNVSEKQQKPDTLEELIGTTSECFIAVTPHYPNKVAMHVCYSDEATAIAMVRKRLSTKVVRAEVKIIEVIDPRKESAKAGEGMG